MKCRVRYVYLDRPEFVGDTIGNPAELDKAARDAGALGVTIVVMP